MKDERTFLLLVENDEEDFEEDDEDEDDSDETSDEISDICSLEMPSMARALPSSEGDRDEALDVSNVSMGAETLIKLELDVPMNGRESTIWSLLL